VDRSGGVGSRSHPGPSITSALLHSTLPSVDVPLPQHVCLSAPLTVFNIKKRRSCPFNYIIQIRCYAYRLCEFLSIVANTRLTTKCVYVHHSYLLFPKYVPIPHPKRGRLFPKSVPRKSVTITLRYSVTGQVLSQK
jgi:hypothetical protein